MDKLTPVRQHDRSTESFSSTPSTVSVLNNSDFHVSCKLYDDLLVVKSKYINVIKAIGLTDTDEIGHYTDEQFTNNVKKVLKPQLIDYLSDILVSVQKYVCQNTGWPKKSCPLFLDIPHTVIFQQKNLKFWLSKPFIILNRF